MCLLVGIEDPQRERIILDVRAIILQANRHERNLAIVVAGMIETERGTQ